MGFSDAKENEAAAGDSDLELECTETPGLAVDASCGSVLCEPSARRASFGECPEVAPSPKAPAVIATLNGSGEVQGQALDYEDSSAVAVDLASAAGSPLGAAAKGDVYVDNADERRGVQRRRVAGPALRLRTAERRARASRSTRARGDVYVADAKADKVDVFEPGSGRARRRVDSVAFQDLSPTVDAS